MAKRGWFDRWFAARHAAPGRRRAANGDLTANPGALARLRLQRLENRLCLSSVAWINPSGGNWDVAANWSTGSVPGSGDDVDINTAAAATITIQLFDVETVHSLTTAGNDTLSITGGSLTVAANSTLMDANSTLNGPLAMTRGGLSATGSGVTFSAVGATNVSVSDLGAVSGATLSLPQLKSFTSADSYFNAEGAKSVLDVSALTTVLTQQGLWDVNAQYGGEVKLTSLTSLTGNNNVTIDDTVGATILDGKLTTLNGVSVDLDGTDAQVANSWTSFTNGSLGVTGGSYTLPNLTDVDDSTLAVTTGGGLALPGLKTYSSNSTFETFEARDPKSVLDVSALTTLTGGGISDIGGGTVLDGKLTTLSGANVSLDGTDTQVANSWTSLTNGSLMVTGGSYTLPNLDVGGSSLSVTTGGKLALPGLRSYSNTGAHDTTFSAIDPQSVLDVSALTSVTGNNNVSIDDTGGATILDGKLTTLNGVSINLDGTDAQVANSWTSLTNGSLTINDASYTLPNLTDIDGSSLTVGNDYAGAPAGSLALPGLKTYSPNGNVYNGNVFTVDSLFGTVQSVLDLSALTTVTPNRHWNVQLNNGELNVSRLTSLIGPQGVTVDRYFNILLDTISDGYGSTLLDGELTTLSGVDVNLNGSDTGVANSWTSFTGGLNLSGGAYTLPNLTDANFLLTPLILGFVGLYLYPSASLSLPVVAAGNIPISSGQSVTIRGTLVSVPTDGTSGAIINVPAAPSALTIDLLNYGTLSGGTTLNVGAGATVDVGSLGNYRPNAIAYTAYLGGVAFNVGAGATVDLSSGQEFSYSGTLIGSGAGTVRFSGGQIDSGSGGLNLNFPGNMFQWTGGDFATLSSPKLTNLGTMNLTGTNPKQMYGNFSNSGSLNVNAGGTLGIGAFGGTVNFSQTSAGTLGIQIGGTPASGQFGEVVVNGTATLAGNFDLTLVNGFAPDAGDEYSALTFASDSGAFAKFSGLPAGMTATQSATALDLAINDDVESPLGAAIAPTAAVMFNGTVATFTGSNPNGTSSDFTASIDWGDGVTSAGGIAVDPKGGFDVTGSHTYAQAGIDIIYIDINALSSGLTQASGTANVAASAPAIADLVESPLAVAIAPSEGALFNGSVATFTGSNPNGKSSDFTASIDWGDGGTSAGGIAADPKGGFDVTGSHTYAQAGFDTIIITINALSGGSATASGTVEVNVAASAGTPHQHQQYVSAVYQDVLGRAPDSSGLAYWAQSLDKGAAVSSVAAAIAHSDEYYANFVIKPAYLKLLGRAADDSGVKYWTGQMDAGATDQQLEADLVSSAEFFKAAGGTNADWIGAVYKLLLGRTADASGVSYWSGQLTAGETLGQVAQGIAGSQENNTQLINDDYFHYLGRAADAGGLDFWLKQFAAGKTNEDVIAGFTGSGEYYKQHTE
ncbi:MAG TPA: DUF4214 domain-containing protein [Pirellulales bacterium]|nr:DUF4214 domain-containing protein [Pirellulales bacterium]